MNFIGNDIVDLGIAAQESNWKRRGYLDKIFTVEEQAMINNSSRPDLTVWTFWAMKEAVYKAHFRKTHIYEYAPSKIRCANIRQEIPVVSEVYYDGSIYYAEMHQSNNILHAVAASDKKLLNSLCRHEIQNFQAEYGLDLQQKGILSQSEQIVKCSDGVPEILDKKNNKRRVISISHHGTILGVVC